MATVYELLEQYGDPKTALIIVERYISMQRREQNPWHIANGRLWGVFTTSCCRRSGLRNSEKIRHARSLDHIAAEETGRDTTKDELETLRALARRFDDEIRTDERLYALYGKHDPEIGHTFGGFERPTAPPTVRLMTDMTKPLRNTQREAYYGLLDQYGDAQTALKIVERHHLYVTRTRPPHLNYEWPWGFYACCKRVSVHYENVMVYTYDYERQTNSRGYLYLCSDQWRRHVQNSLDHVASEELGRDVTKEELKILRALYKSWDSVRSDKALIALCHDREIPDILRNMDQYIAVFGGMHYPSGPQMSRDEIINNKDCIYIDR